MKNSIFNVKKWIAMIALLLAQAVLMPSAVASYVPGLIYSNNGSRKSIYETADASAKVVASLDTKATFEVESQSGNWLHISYYRNGVKHQGWITTDSVGSVEDDGYVPPVLQTPATRPTSNPGGNKTPKPQSPVLTVHLPIETLVYGTAVVTSPNGMRLNLRENQTIESKSLGLYYAGTTVLLNTNPDLEWVSVIIGNRAGYMLSKYLYKNADATSVQGEMPVMKVANGNPKAWLNLREHPSKTSKVLGKFYDGDLVTVMGTVDGWYHVIAGGKIGFMMPSFLKSTGSPTPSQQARNQYSVNTRLARGVGVQAVISKISASQQAIQVQLAFDKGYTTLDDIKSFNLYINGSLVASVFPYWDTDNQIMAPTTFYSLFPLQHTMNTIQLVPVLEKGGEATDEAIVIK